ncbi:MAG: gamma-glutamyl-gamma-aminobutyrate hydrolase family protein, partial [Gemmatimonadota bacterium]|nr:gamma-glutamyl-gamma-aminobutyrate hydrolase family protein [Gemmatimonadota bacterium]
GVPWMIPLLDDDLETLREIYLRLDGVLIPGGVDLDPRSYGEERHPRLGAVDPARDRVEIQLVRWALADRKPVLGLCRGAQIINVALGGTLYQDLEAQFPGALKHDYFPTAGFSRDYLAHEVALAPGSRLMAAMERPRVMVNSMHHQGIRALAEGLVPSAVAPDGLIEAVERPGEHFLVGVQWHPEMFEMTDPHTRHLFREFIGAAQEWRARVGSQ